MSRLTNSSSVICYLSPGGAVCSCSVHVLVPTVSSDSCHSVVFTADCAGCEVRRGSGGDLVTDARVGRSFARATESVGDNILVWVMIPRGVIADKAVRSDKHRRRYGTDMICGGTAEGLAMAT